jgi:hypothetical protein
VKKELTLGTTPRNSESHSSQEIPVSMQHGVIERRKVLKYIGLIAATAAGQEFLAGWLPGKGGLMAAAPTVTKTSYSPLFFNREEYNAVEVLTELIIPADDRPGAREARVAEFIDFTVNAAAEFKPELQQHWTEGLSLLDRLSSDRFERPFIDLDPSSQESLLTEMSVPEQDPGSRHPGFEFYKLVKEMTVEGFYTSEVGLIDVLEFQGNTYLSEFPGCTHPEHQL